MLSRQGLLGGDGFTDFVRQDEPPFVLDVEGRGSIAERHSPLRRLRISRLRADHRERQLRLAKIVPEGTENCLPQSLHL